MYSSTVSLGLTEPSKPKSPVKMAIAINTTMTTATAAIGSTSLSMTAAALAGALLEVVSVNVVMAAAITLLTGQGGSETTAPY